MFSFHIIEFELLVFSEGVLHLCWWHILVCSFLIISLGNLGVSPFLIILQSTEFQVGSGVFFVCLFVCFLNTSIISLRSRIVCKDSEKFDVILIIVLIWLKWALCHHSMAANWIILFLIFCNLRKIFLGVVF